MRAPAILGVLLALLAVLAGCTAGDDRDGEADGGADRDEGAAEDGPGSAQETAPGGGADGDGPTGKDTSGSAGSAQDPDRPSPPDEQQKDTREAVTRPGDYMLLPAREGARTDVRLDAPTWSAGDEWVYDLWIAFAPQCTPGPGATFTDYRATDTVRDRGEEQGIAVYHVRQTVTACNGTKLSDQDYSYASDHLVRVDADGYRAHLMLFPLEDGKRWYWLDDERVGYTSEVTYLSAYVWDTQTVAAWKIVSTRDEGGIEAERIFGETARNVLRAEDRLDGVAFQEARLHSYRSAP